MNCISDSVEHLSQKTQCHFGGGVDGGVDGWVVVIGKYSLICCRIKCLLCNFCKILSTGNITLSVSKVVRRKQFDNLHKFFFFFFPLWNIQV